MSTAMVKVQSITTWTRIRNIGSQTQSIKKKRHMHMGTVILNNVRYTFIENSSLDNEDELFQKEEIFLIFVGAALRKLLYM